VKLDFPQGDAIYMFFETKNSVTSQGDIAAAVSKDAGATWQQLGVVLDEEWHLSFPYVFSYNDRVNIPFKAAYSRSGSSSSVHSHLYLFYLPHSADLYDARK
jgi:Neuraminidase (sialidase)